MTEGPTHTAYRLIQRRMHDACRIGVLTPTGRADDNTPDQDHRFGARVPCRYRVDRLEDVLGATDVEQVDAVLYLPPTVDLDDDDQVLLIARYGQDLAEPIRCELIGPPRVEPVYLIAKLRHFSTQAEAWIDEG
jgi:hypothetical protein